MAQGLLTAKLDVIFKKIFIENDDLLQDFISAILDIPNGDIRKIEIKDPELPPEFSSGKFSRLDLSLDIDGTLVNVEIQIKNDKYYRDRTLFYWSKLYTSELKGGEPYGRLKRTVTINLINFNMFDKNDYHTEVVPVIKDTGEIFSDKMSIHFFELKKIGNDINPNDRKKLWLQFINADKEEEFNMLENTNVMPINKAVQVIRDMSSDTRTREIARMREKMLHDEASALANAKAEGVEEGIEKGIVKGENKMLSGIIGKLRKKGYTDEEIKNLLEMDIING